MEIRFLSPAGYNELFNCLEPEDRWTQVISVSGTEKFEALVLRNPVAGNVIYFAARLEKKE